MRCSSVTAVKNGGVTVLPPGCKKFLQKKRNQSLPSSKLVLMEVFDELEHFCSSFIIKAFSS
jgi:hypothetical protein